MQASNKGMFLPTNVIWDVGQTKEIEASESMKELLVRMYQNLGTMSNVINLKESAIYDTGEFVTGKVYPANSSLTSQTSHTPEQRQVIRKFINFGPLSVNGLNAKPHHIPFNKGYILTDLIATATDPVNLLYYPLPFVDLTVGGGHNISIWVDGTNVNIHTNGTIRTAFSIVYVVIEYLRY